ncbi:MAG: DUF1838 family protein [Saprospiraceae bacterium]|nr:DUF1838 family protein [Saprospiraceae bacterium]
MKHIWCLPLIFCISFHLNAQSLEFTPEVFEKWINLRAGNGKKPVYWYCYGELYSYPEGKLVARVQGLDVATWFAPRPDSVVQLNRKIFLYLDKDNNRILDTIGGVPVNHIKYPYQIIEYVLKGNALQTYVTQGSGSRLLRIGPNASGKVKKVGKNLVFSFPAFMNFQTAKGKYEAYENFDFFLNENAGRLDQKYQLTWWRYGEIPAFLGGGRSVMQLVCHRVSDISELPDPIRAYIENKATMWKLPPRNMQEVDVLQKE